MFIYLLLIYSFSCIVCLLAATLSLLKNLLTNDECRAVKGAVNTNIFLIDDVYLGYDTNVSLHTLILCMSVLMMMMMTQSTMCCVGMINDGVVVQHNGIMGLVSSTQLVTDGTKKLTLSFFL
jgi:hypothetical protein